MKLSLLICTMPERKESLTRLINELYKQMASHDGIEIIYNDSMSISVGEKRNILLNDAKGEYCCFIDDDDWVDRDYIDILMEAVESGKDCASLMGLYIADGKDEGVFEHSIKHKKWETVEGQIKYLRYPNHLNMIRSSIAKQFKFPEKNFGEDFDWSTQIHKSGMVKTEHYVDEITYYYQFNSKK